MGACLVVEIMLVMVNGGTIWQIIEQRGSLVFNKSETKDANMEKL